MWSKLYHTKSLSRKELSKKKNLLKQCEKEVTYEYILAFAEYWSILWVVGGGEYILAGGGWWRVVVHIFWLVVDGGGGGG